MRQVDEDLASPDTGDARISTACAAPATSLRHYYPEVVGLDGSSRLSRVLAGGVQAREERPPAEDPRHAAGRASGAADRERSEAPRPANKMPDR